MRSREIIKRLEAEGWTLLRVKGSHHIYGRNGQVVVVPHPRSDYPPGTLRAIFRQAGLPWPP